MNYISVHRLANKLHIPAQRIYWYIRNNKLIEGKDFIRSAKKVVRIEVREDLTV
jgi:hypothetical protein